MSILDKIVLAKKEEVKIRKQNLPESKLMHAPHFQRQPYNLKEFILRSDKTGIIAEFKRRSPSAGVINATSGVEEITRAYEKYGASAISILTDEKFFGGSLSDLQLARTLPLPLLRKDFIIDPYQILESKAAGADVILLIAACLTVQEVKDFSRKARDLGLSTLLEIHDESEIGHYCETIDIIGINNRNLKTFSVNLEHSIELFKKLPEGIPTIAESGISDPKTILRLKAEGFSGFLIGGAFMQTADPGNAFKNFIQKIKS